MPFWVFAFHFYSFMFVLGICLRCFDCKRVRTKKWWKTAKTWAKMQLYTDMMPNWKGRRPLWHGRPRASAQGDKTWRIWAPTGWRVSRHLDNVCRPSMICDSQGVRAMTSVMVLQFRYLSHVFRLGHKLSISISTTSCMFWDTLVRILAL